MSDQEDFIRRMKQFPNVQLQPSSYQLRNQDGSPGAWASRVHVWDNRHDASIVTPIWPTPKKHYTSRDAANATAMWLALKWLEEGRPDLPPLADC